jgi:hypothetical protein
MRWLSANYCTSKVCVVEPVCPTLFVTVSVMTYEPVAEYEWATVAVGAVVETIGDPSPKSHVYRVSAPVPGVDALPSKVTDVPVVVGDCEIVKFATGSAANFTLSELIFVAVRPMSS